MRRKLLIISDAPTKPTGLGRIAGDLAIRIHNDMPEFDVATFGYGGTYSNKLPYPQYPMTHVSNYVATEIIKVWNDFAGDEKGVVLTIWNPSWCGWLSNPESMVAGGLRDFLMDAPFELWGYFPIDADSPSGRLPATLGDTIGGYDRVLAYTKFGAQAIEKTCPMLHPVEYLPHGLDTSVFYPRDRVEARRTFVNRVTLHEPAELAPGLFLVGVVATNTPRKDWYLAFQACAKLKQSGVKVGMWAHTDAWAKAWHLESLMQEFEMHDRVMFTNHEMTDDDLAWAYTACDVTFGIGAGEGWGYPLAESLACGTPCIHGDFAGGAEIVPASMRVKPQGYKGDGFFGIHRPVFDPSRWAHTAITAAMGVNPGVILLPEYIDWKNAWPRWKQWLQEGLDGFGSTRNDSIGAQIG